MDYSRLDPLISISGEKIETVEDWETFRREEIMVLLSNFIYGVCPMGRPDDLRFSVDRITENYLGYPLVRKEITISFLDFSFPINLFLPQRHYKNRPVPLFLHILNETSMNKYLPVENPDNDFLPIVKLAERGYGCVTMSTLAVCPDWHWYPDFQKGVFKAVQPNKAHRDQRSWAIIAGWAYGASRVMDYLETDPDVRHTKVGICGHSRAGKTALWAGANDPRFALVISNDSGCTGAAFIRGTTEGRERLQNLGKIDWFCGNYKKHKERDEMMPCDQHWVLAAIAPRPLYVKSNVEDIWAGPDEELLSCRLASPVYELYGMPGLIAEEKIQVGKPYHEGTIAYRRAAGDHNLNTEDWMEFLNFADTYLKPPK